jgi:hypothetical protein
MPQNQPVVALRWRDNRVVSFWWNKATNPEKRPGDGFCHERLGGQSVSSRPFFSLAGPPLQQLACNANETDRLLLMTLTLTPSFTAAWHEIAYRRQVRQDFRARRRGHRQCPQLARSYELD